MQFMQCCAAAISLFPEPAEYYVCHIKERVESSAAFKGLTTMFLSHLVGVFQQWRRYNNSLRELNRLGDRELADIGITRGDIPRVAWENSEH
jgi:uncharacterized protein YjiS (DUF1127 family)